MKDRFRKKPKQEQRREELRGGEVRLEEHGEGNGREVRGWRRRKVKGLQRKRNGLGGKRGGGGGEREKPAPSWARRVRASDPRAPPAGVCVPGDAAGAAARGVLPQDVAFSPPPAPGRPEPGPAVAACSPGDAPQQRQALFSRRGWGRGQRARGAPAPPGRPGAAWRGPAPRPHPLHPRARLPGMPAHPGAAGLGGRRAPAWPGCPRRGHQPAAAATWPPRAGRTRVTTGRAGRAPGLTTGMGPAPGPGRPRLPSGRGTGLVSRWAGLRDFALGSQ